MANGRRRSVWMDIDLHWPTPPPPPPPPKSPLLKGYNIYARGRCTPCDPFTDHLYDRYIHPLCVPPYIAVAAATDLPTNANVEINRFLSIFLVTYLKYNVYWYILLWRVYEQRVISHPKIKTHTHIHIHTQVHTGWF